MKEVRQRYRKTSLDNDCRRELHGGGRGAVWETNKEGGGQSHKQVLLIRKVLRIHVQPFYTLIFDQWIRLNADGHCKRTLPIPGEEEKNNTSLYNPHSIPSSFLGTQNCYFRAHSEKGNPLSSAWNPEQLNAQ